MGNIKAIGFDWIGVMVKGGYSFPEAVQAYFGISRDDFRKVYFKHNRLINVGEVNMKYFWSVVLREFGKDDQLDGFLQFMHGLPRGGLDMAMINLVKNLRKNGYPVGLLSNHSKEGAADARALGIDDVFDVTLFSGEIGYMKPEPSAFALLAEKLGVALEEMIFIDDTQQSLSTASDVGYTPILFTGIDELKQDLTRLLTNGPSGVSFLE